MMVFGLALRCLRATHGLGTTDIDDEKKVNF